MDKRDLQQAINGPSVDSIRNSQVITCTCGSVLFTEKITFRKISALISPTGKEEVTPLSFIVCDGCKKVLPIFDPHDLAPKEIKANALNIVK